ncbi:MAG TPA: sulfurtransferase [Kofleriaceae bacterium]|jgi:thiosulfate/3-mercaptopyruvate sulfurtransferase|nr:sulfurtransferase [Kofleriaceae bacterium]
MPVDPVISPRELAALTDPVIVDCRPDARAYAAGHLPRAVHAQLERDLAGPAPDPARGGRHPLPLVRDLTATLGRWGITPRKTVVAYDDQNGANAASRFWWLLKALGQPDVRVVDGGLAALRDAGFTLTTEVPEPEPEPPFPVLAWVRDIADIDEVERARTAADRRVIDVRAPFRFRGESEPIDPIAGHIPGARNAPFADNLRPDGSFKSADELRALLTTALDGIPPERTIVHCGSGVTACHTLLAMERAGMRGAKLYVGSWSEWCRQPDRARDPA